MEMKYCKLTEKSVAWFAPLLSEEADQLLKSDPTVFAIGAAREERACGVLVFRATEEMADMLYIAVDERNRREGIATGMVEYLCQHAGETVTPVTCTFSAADLDDPIYRLLNKRGDFSIAEEEGYICRVSCASLQDAPLNVKAGEGMRETGFYTMPAVRQSAFFTALRQENPEYARGLRAEERNMLRSLCLCAGDPTGVQAAVFCRNQGTDVSLRFAYSTAKGQRGLISLLGRLRDLLVKGASPVEYLYIAVVNPQSTRLVETLLPQREITERFYRAVWDMDHREG